MGRCNMEAVAVWRQWQYGGRGNMKAEGQYEGRGNMEAKAIWEAAVIWGCSADKRPNGCVYKMLT